MGVAGLLREVWYAMRVWFAKPALAGLAVLVLALSIGAATAMFSMADAILFKSLPFVEGHRLAMVVEIPPGNSSSDWNYVAPANFLDWVRETHSFDRLAAYSLFAANAVGADNVERVQGSVVSSQFFEALQVHAAVGRLLEAEDFKSGQNCRVVISHGFWERHFGGVADVTGQTVLLDGVSCDIVGVMPKEFGFPFGTDVWRPLQITGAGANRSVHSLEVLGRLAPGQSMTSAGAEMSTIAKRLAASYPETNRGWDIRVVSVRDHLSGTIVKPFTLLMLGIVVCVVVTACVNIAGLQLVRSIYRRREFAVRTALGATRLQLLRQLIVEGLVLSFSASGAGVLLAWLGLQTILAQMPPEVAPYVVGWSSIRMDLRALAMAGCLASVTGILTGLIPALLISSETLVFNLREQARGVSSGRRTRRLQRVFVFAQVAFVVLILDLASAIVASSRQLVRGMDAYRPSEVLTFRLSLPDRPYSDPARAGAYYDGLLERLSFLPAEAEAALATDLPFDNNRTNVRLTVPGYVATLPNERQVAQFQSVSPSYFQVMGIPLREGRLLGDGDSAQTMPVMVISQSLASRYWPERSALGQRVQVDLPHQSRRDFTVVGIVGDIQYDWDDSRPQRVAYFTYRQAPNSAVYVALRTPGRDATLLGSSVRQELAQLDPGVAPFHMKPLSRVISDSTFGLSLLGWLTSAIGFIVLIVAIGGVYTTVAFAIAERKLEIGIRMALGAGSVHIASVLATKALVTVVGAGLLGFGIAVVLGHVLEDSLIVVNFEQIGAMVGVAVGLLLIVISALAVPIARASRMNPIDALRAD